MAPPASPRAASPLAARAVSLMVVVLALLCAGIGAAIFGVGVSFGREGWALWSDGVPTQGEVVAKELRRNPGRGGGINHVVRYAYTADGRTHQGEAIVDESDYAALPVGAAVPVRHVAGQPAVSALESEFGFADAFLAPGFALLVGTLLLGCGAYLLFAGIRGLVRGPPR